MRRIAIAIVGASVGCLVTIDDSRIGEGMDAGVDAAIDVVAPDDASSSDGGVDYRAVVLSDAPTVYYRLDETTVDARDEVSGFDATYGVQVTRGQAPLVRGSLGAVKVAANIASFDSTIHSPRRAQLETDVVTVECWVSFTGANAAQHRIVTYGQVDAAPFQPWALQVGNPGGNGAAFDFYVARGMPYHNEDGYVHGARIVPFDAGRTHVVGTFDKNAVRIYVNGDLDVEKAVDKPGPLSNYDGSAEGLGIGGASIGDGFSGFLDEVAIYDHVLGADRVRAHYEAGR